MEEFKPEDKVTFTLDASAKGCTGCASALHAVAQACQPADPRHPYVAVAPCCKRAYHMLPRHGQYPSDTHVAGPLLATHDHGITEVTTTAGKSNDAHMRLLLYLGPICPACSGAPSPSCQRPPAPPTGHATAPCCRQAGNHKRGTGTRVGYFSLDWKSQYLDTRCRTVWRQGRVLSEYMVAEEEVEEGRGTLCQSVGHCLGA